MIARRRAVFSMIPREERRSAGKYDDLVAGARGSIGTW